MLVTGRRERFEGQTIARVKEGLIVERWSTTDVVGLLIRRGAIPTPGA
jgi:predicted ester cyclase